jgi:hypothetical protein
VYSESDAAGDVIDIHARSRNEPDSSTNLPQTTLRPTEALASVKAYIQSQYEWIPILLAMSLIFMVHSRQQRYNFSRETTVTTGDPRPTGAGSDNPAGAGVSKRPQVVRSFHSTLLSFLVASLSFRPIHHDSQEMIAAKICADLTNVGNHCNVMSRELIPHHIVLSTELNPYSPEPEDKIVACIISRMVDELD